LSPTMKISFVQRPGTSGPFKSPKSSERFGSCKATMEFQRFATFGRSFALREHANESGPNPNSDYTI